MLHNTTPDGLFKEGARAAAGGGKKVDCPYPTGSQEAKYWLKGFDDHKKFPGRGTAFQNGVTKAQAEIQNKLGNRFGNIAMGITSFDIEQLEKEIKKKGFSAVKERLNTGYMKASVGDNYDIKQLYEKQLNILDKIQSRMNNIR